MKSFKVLYVCFAALFGLSACNVEEEIEDTVLAEEDVDRTFIGSNAEASWRLELDDDSGYFSLYNLNNPGSSDETYVVNGTFTTTGDNWFELNISSDLEDELESSEIQGIEIGDHAIMLSPFTNVDDEWVPLIKNTGCPSSDLGGLAIMLNQPSDASADDVAWITDFDYDDEVFEYYDGIALDENFTVQNSFFQLSDDCTDGYVQRSAGDHYLGEAASLVELDDDNAPDGYTRALSLPIPSLDIISDIDSDQYIGLVRDFADPTDHYQVTAQCVDGVCVLQNSDENVLELNLPSSGLNYANIDGTIIGTISDYTDTMTDTRVVCMANPNIANSDEDDHEQKLILCSGQSLSDNTAAIQILLSAIEDE